MGSMFKLLEHYIEFILYICYLSNIYDRRDNLSFKIVNFPFLDEDVTRFPTYGVYISQLVRFARVCSNVSDFNNRNNHIVLLLSHENKSIDVIKFVKHLLNSTTDTQNTINV